jgi:hypothetical protein
MFQSKIFFSYGDIIIAGEWVCMVYAQHSGYLNAQALYRATTAVP